MATPNGPAAIRTRGLCKNYGSRPAVIDVDLVVQTGEVFGFLGPNGAGKSTTIRVLLDLLRPTSGEVAVLGADPRRAGAELRRRVGYLPSEFVIYERESVGTALHSLGACVAESTVDGSTASLIGCSSISAAPCGNSRKAIGRRSGWSRPSCTIRNCLILDEPTAGLDPAPAPGIHHDGRRGQGSTDGRCSCPRTSFPRCRRWRTASA